MSRLLRRVYAALGGYFWLPCPACGEMFGGHEIGECARLDGAVCRRCSHTFRCCGGYPVGDRLVHQHRFSDGTVLMVGEPVMRP